MTTRAPHRPLGRGPAARRSTHEPPQAAFAGRSPATSSPPPTACRPPPTSSATSGSGSSSRPARPRRAARGGAAPGARRRTPTARLATLERDEPDQPRRAAAGRSSVAYYTDRDVRELHRLSGPGWRSSVSSWKVPDYIEEGLIDAVLARGPVWRDPATGAASPRPPTYASARRAPTPKETPMVATRLTLPTPGWLDPFLAELAPGLRRAARGPRAGDRPAAADHRPVDGRGRRRAPPPRPRPPSRPGPRRATRSARRILRRAAEIYEAHRPEFGTLDPARDRRGPRNKMHHEQNFAVGELHAAATMPCQPYGQLVPTRRAGAAVDDPPRAGRRHRRDHAVELAERARHARRRAGARAGQRGRPQARSADAGLRRRDVRGGLQARPACPTGCSRSSSATPRSARRSSPTRTSTLISFTGSTEVGRRVGALAGEPAQEGLASSSAATTRSSSSTTPTSTAAASAGAFASFQFQGQVCFATGRHIVHRSVADDVRRPARREGAAAADSATRTARTSTSGRSSTSSSSSASTASSSRSVDARRAARRGRHVRGPVLPTDRARRRDDRARRVDARRSSARSRRCVTFDTDDEALALANDSEYGLAGAVYSRSISRGLALAKRIRAGMVHVNDQTDERRGDHPVRRDGRVRQRRPLRRRGQLGRVHRSGSG